MLENQEEPIEQIEDPVIETIPVTEATAQVLEARQEIRREAQAIAELCLIAGHPDKAASFIAAGQTEAEVRQLLLSMKAANQSAEILSAIDPDKAAETQSLSSNNNPLISAVKKITAKE